MATIVSSNNEINNNMKIVNILGESDLLMKGVSKTITKLNKITKKCGFLSMLLSALGVILLRNLLKDKIALETQHY